MIRDLQQHPSANLLQADICIVGAGVAGITLARELGAANLSVLLLESGAEVPEKETQDLYEGQSSGLPPMFKQSYLRGSRLRFLGGSSNHWEGWCRPLDVIDFETRSWVADSGWPFGIQELAEDYKRAAALVEISSFTEENSQPFSVSNPLFANASRLFGTKYFFYSPPTRFGKTYALEIQNSSKITLVTHANLRNIELSADGKRVSSVQISTLGGVLHQVRAQVFVLAAGGVENARLLLVSRNQEPKGIGNQHDQVGRYFAEHPRLRVGQLWLRENKRTLNVYDLLTHPLLKHEVRGFLAPTEFALRKHQLLNFCLELSKPTKKENLAKLSSTFKGLSLQQEKSANTAADARVYDLIARLEQSPNPASRISLSQETDSLGMPRAELDWRVRAEDFQSIARGLKLMALEVGRINQGRVRLLINAEPKWPGVRGSAHHMGTTRMGTNPETSVLNPEARVHGIENLYLAGSSVFPTTGFANPTLTILALTLRLGREILRGWKG